MKCVSSFSYNILINGNPTDKVFPSRGLRQEDPLSPYLYILCGEALLQTLISQAKFSSISFAKAFLAGISILMLQFADDLDDLPFFSINLPKALRLIDKILSDFSSQPGQRVNHIKSQLLFSKKHILNNFSNLFYMSQILFLLLHYLGSSLSISNHTKASWNRVV